MTDANTGSKAQAVSHAVRKKKQSQSLLPRNAPMQDRSKQRSQQIIDATAQLLDEIGPDDLNTILIARAVGISVGSLYHYFPNKHAILHAMGTRWLDQVESALDEIARWPIEQMKLDELLPKMLKLKLGVYRRQKAILALVQAMFSVPELRELDEQHDELEITRMAEVFQRMGVHRHIRERERLGRLYLETTHSVFLVVVNQKGDRAKRTFADLEFMLTALLRTYLPDLPDA